MGFVLNNKKTTREREAEKYEQRGYGPIKNGGRRQSHGQGVLSKRLLGKKHPDSARNPDNMHKKDDK